MKNFDRSMIPEAQRVRSDSLPLSNGKHMHPILEKSDALAADAAASPKDDSAPFAEIMRDTIPLKGKGRSVATNPAPGSPFPPRQESFQELVEKTLEFALNFSKEYVEGHVVGLDMLILQKLRAGSHRPEAHLDLHGLNARQAFDTLIAFMRQCWGRGRRVVLLIPGRGRNSPGGVSVLRERVQSWLTQEPLKRVILAFCTAKSADGGAGGLYVLLRKYKKKGKICWDRMPVDVDL